MQQTFRASAGALRAAGVHYFADAPNHAQIGASFHGPTATPAALALRRRLLRQLRAAAVPQALVSAENLVRLSPEEAAACVAHLRTVARRVQVLLYVRHPVSFANSAAGQGLRSGKRLATVERKPRVVPLRALVETWEAAAGADGLVVRPYDRAQLAGGDVVADVCAVLGVPAVVERLERVEGNEGLSVLAAHLIDRAVRKAGREALPRGALAAIETVKGPRYVLPAAALERARRDGAADLAWIEARFGLRLPEPVLTPSAPPALTDAELDTLADALGRLSRIAFWQRRADFVAAFGGDAEPPRPRSLLRGVRDWIGARDGGAGRR